MRTIGLVIAKDKLSEENTEKPKIPAPAETNPPESENGELSEQQTEEPAEAPSDEQTEETTDTKPKVPKKKAPKPKKEDQNGAE